MPRFNWTFDAATQELVTPTGRRISVAEIAGLFRAIAEGRGLLPAEWRGWRLHGRKLIGPGKVVLTPDAAPYFARWVQRHDSLPRNDEAISAERATDQEQTRPVATASQVVDMAAWRLRSGRR